MGWGIKWKVKEDEEMGPPESQAIVASCDESQIALDAVAHLVRIYGQYAFDTDEQDASETSEQCEDWAARILVGSTRKSENKDSSCSTRAKFVRDWPGITQFVGALRRAESEYVVRSLGNLRQAVLCFAGCLGKTVEEERKSDVTVSARLDDLSRVVEERDPERVMQEARRVVDSVRGAMVARRKREVEQVWALGERLRELREQLSDARRLAEVDALTELMNRAAFDQYIEHLSTLGLLLGEPPWLMIADLDNFKAINDKYGHPTGDEVLRQVSRCFDRTFLRKQDFVCRYGGEEFAVLLIDTTADQMKQLAERLATGVRGLVVEHRGQEIKITISMGLASLGAGEQPGAWLERADQALYRAKAGGRDQYSVAPGD